MNDKELTIDNLRQKLIKGCIITIDGTECKSCVISKVEDRGIYFLTPKNYLGFIAWWWIEDNIEDVHILGQSSSSDINDNTVLPTLYDTEE